MNIYINNFYPSVEIPLFLGTLRRIRGSVRVLRVVIFILRLSGTGHHGRRSGLVLHLHRIVLCLHYVRNQEVLNPKVPSPSPRGLLSFTLSSGSLCPVPPLGYLKSSFFLRIGESFRPRSMSLTPSVSVLPSGLAGF